MVFVFGGDGRKYNAVRVGAVFDVSQERENPMRRTLGASCLVFACSGKMESTPFEGTTGGGGTSSVGTKWVVGGSKPTVSISGGVGASVTGGSSSSSQTGTEIVVTP